MESRIDWNGKGAGHDGDKTTTGATCIGNYPEFTENGKMLLRVGDKTTVCPRCNQVGTIVSGDPTVILDGKLAAVDDSIIACGCPYGTHRLIAPLLPSSINYYLSTTEPEPAQEKPLTEHGKITLPMLRKIWMDKHYVSDQTLQEVADELNANFKKCHLDNEYRLYHFMAQVFQEVGPTFTLSESFNYTPTGLIATFGYYKKHLREAYKDGRTAKHPIVNQPLIANKAYGGRFNRLC